MAKPVLGACLVVGLVSLSPRLSLAQDTSPSAPIRPPDSHTSSAARLTDASAPAQFQLVEVREWTVARTGPVFVADGDAVRVTGGGGWLRNRVEFVDFTLHLEYRTLERNAEAAVLVRASPRRDNGSPSAGYRIAIREGRGSGNALGAVRGYARRVRAIARERPESDSFRVATGDWQRLEVRAEGDRVTVILNEAIVNMVEGTEPLAGYIGFEGSRGTVEFRNVRVHRRAQDSGLPCADRAAEGLHSLAAAQEVYRPGGTGLVNPRVLLEVKPRYSMDALERKTEGVVLLEAVVMPDGGVGRACVVRGLDEDLDAESLAAARRWRFQPATLNGAPVPVLVTIELTFILVPER